MKKLLIPLQLLACWNLAAEEIVAANAPQKERGRAQCASSAPFAQGDASLAAAPMVEVYPAVYNRSANTQLDSSWELYGDISYIYWDIKQEGLDVATAGQLYESYVWESSGDGYAVFQDTDYTSGFRIGLGANLNVDDWALDFNYTYLRQHTSTSATATSPDGDVAAFNVSAWFWATQYGQGTSATEIHSKWKFALDLCDLTLKRPYYRGRYLVVTPEAGLRASWIRQRLTVFSPLIRNDYDEITSADATSTNASHSWAIGPRAAINTHWLLGFGFRIQGSMGASILFTQFTNVSHREPGIYDDDIPLNGPVETGLSNYNCLRAMTEADLGIGWGGYLYQKTYHLDFAATYDFNYLWSQNMMRYLVGPNISMPSSGSAGDLMLHGLELKARFDF